MDQENKVTGWYDTTERRQWYRQYSLQQEAVPQAAEAPKKKKRTALKVTMIAICVLILIAASALAFGDFGKNDPPAEDLPPEEPQSTQIIIPGYGDSLDPFGGFGYGGYEDFDRYEDYKDFFDNYYTTEDADGSDIERADTDPALTLPLESSEGLEKLSLQELYKKCRDSVVGITAGYSEEEPVSTGSGIVMTEDGYILTNQHIIDGLSFAKVTLTDGSEYSALLVGEDPQSDIAVLKIEAQGLTAAQFGSSDELVVGDEVVAIGNPLGAELAGTMTDGIVSAINRNIPYNGHQMSLIQTNAAINSGNSGGPLFNIYGQVIGITNMKMNSNYFSTTIEGIGFAIPSTVVKEVADQLLAEGKVSGRPGIGITCGAVPPGAAAQYDLPQGVYISKVTPGSDAEAKGLQEGDVICSINGEEVRSTDDVNAVKDRYGVGDKLDFYIYRNGEYFNVEVELYDMNQLF